MSTPHLPEVEAFLYAEARALDDRDWDSWLAFYAPDASFWMPAWDDNDRIVEDPQAEISLIYYAPPSRGRRTIYQMSKSSPKATAKSNCASTG